MGRTIVVVAGLLVAFASDALAKAPTLAELPTVKMVTEQGEKLVAEKLAKDLADQQDPKMDLISDYAGHKVNYWQFQKVADLLIDDKEELKYRRAAAKAFLTRFEDLDPWDAQVKKVKLRIGGALVKEMHDPKLEVRHLVAQIFEKYWPGQYSRFGYDPEEAAYAKRNKAVKKWREFLAGR